MNCLFTLSLSNKTRPLPKNKRLNFNTQEGNDMSDSANAKHPKLQPEGAYTTSKAPKNFPTARYFQVHFEFLQEQIQLMKNMQEVMLMQMNQLEQRLLMKQQHLFSDDQHPFATQHSSLISHPADKQADLLAGINNTKKG